MCLSAGTPARWIRFGVRAQLDGPEPLRALLLKSQTISERRRRWPGTPLLLHSVAITLAP